ncbi:MAG: cupin domain-containing protein [Phycisphaerales bacterium]|nr:cupin domain-containing protein [Phycisphaerales bacterium]
MNTVEGATYTLVQDLAKHQEIPQDGILTRTVFDGDHLKTVLFTFSKGQELSEHTASTPAVLHFLEGSARLTLGHETMEVRSGAWVHMPAQMCHGIHALTPVKMLLLLIKHSDQGKNGG